MGTVWGVLEVAVLEVVPEAMLLEHLNGTKIDAYKKNLSSEISSSLLTSSDGSWEFIGLRPLDDLLEQDLVGDEGCLLKLDVAW